MVPHQCPQDWVILPPLCGYLTPQARRRPRWRLLVPPPPLQWRLLAPPPLPQREPLAPQLAQHLERPQAHRLLPRRCPAQLHRGRQLPLELGLILTPWALMILPSSFSSRAANVASANAASLVLKATSRNSATPIDRPARPLDGVAALSLPRVRARVFDHTLFV